MSRRALRSTGSRRMGSPASSLLRRAPTSRCPALARLRSPSAVPSCRRSTRDLPSSSATLATRAPALRPRWNFGSRPPGRCPYASLLRCCLPSLPSRRLPRHGHFGVRFRSPRARCLRFAARVAPVPRKTRFRLAALPSPGGSSTRWVAAIGFRHHSGVTWRPPLRGFLGAQQEARSVIERQRPQLVLRDGEARHGLQGQSPTVDAGRWLPVDELDIR